MTAELPKRPYSAPEVEQPSLAPDLEWMLSSNQVSHALIVETIVKEYYAALYRLAYSLLDSEQEAKQAAQEVILDASVNRWRYTGGEDVKVWLLGLMVDSYRRRSPAESPLRSKQVSGESTGSAVGKILDGLTPFERAAAFLHYTEGLSESEIARILRLKENQIRSSLHHLREDLEQSRPPEMLSQEAFDAWLSQSLQNHWPLSPPSEAEIEEVAASVKARLDQKSRRVKALTLFQQGLLALGMLISIALMGWLTDRYALSAGPRKPVVVTVVVTQIVRREVTRVVTATPRSSTVSPQATPWLRQPLSPAANEAEIRMRMIESRAVWHSLYVEALIVQSGPAGYIGPPRVYRNRVWVSHYRPENPKEEHLVLSGELAGEPLYAFWKQDGQVYEVDFSSRLSYTYPQSAPNSPFYSLTAPPYLRTFGLGQRGILDGTYLLRLLFPAGLATEDGDLRPAGQAQILGRDALVVDKVSQGVAKSRLWVDAQSGIVLAWERLDDNDATMDVDSITLTAFELEAPFPDENQLRQVLHLYDASSLGWQPMPEEAYRSYAAPRRGQEPFTEQVPPPQGFDPSQSRLFFQWGNTAQPSNATWPEGAQQASSPGDIAAIFTPEGYFLGQAAMGNPWDLLCARSPDGNKIAFSHLSLDPGRGAYISEGIYWFTLEDVSELHNVLPNAVSMGSGFAFSPDSRYLAFWGCGGKEENCGIYIHDTETHKNRKLAAVNVPSEFLAWTPDGQYLSIVEGWVTYSYLVVVQVSSGKIVSAVPYSWSDQSLPPDAPTHGWGLPGLEGCSEPPAK